MSEGKIIGRSKKRENEDRYKEKAREIVVRERKCRRHFKREGERDKNIKTIEKDKPCKMLDKGGKKKA